MNRNVYFYMNCANAAREKRDGMVNNAICNSYIVMGSIPNNPAYICQTRSIRICAWKRGIIIDEKENLTKRGLFSERNYCNSHNKVLYT